MKHRLFLDMDGVLADFDRAAVEKAGIIYPVDESKDGLKEFRRKIYAVDEFFFNLEPMPDMMELVMGTAHLDPIILTGVPRDPSVVDQKKRWGEKYLPTLPMICCKSEEKILRAKELCTNGEIPVLVDDWEKYRHLWIEGGGVFILHTSASNSLWKLSSIFDL